MGAAARYRASLLKSVLTMLEEDYPEQIDEILAGIDPDLLHTIEQVSRADWVDARGMFLINARINEVLGPEGFTRFWRDFARTASRVPMIKPLAEAAARLFGSGKGLMKMLPRSFHLVSRDMATMTMRDLENGMANVELTGFGYPEHFALFCEANRASMEGALQLVGEQPIVELVEADPEAGRAWMRATW